MLLCFARNLVGLFVVSCGLTGFAREVNVGANYHLHDCNRETWTRDIRLMQEGGSRVVRMGPLAWDRYEPKGAEVLGRIVGLDQGYPFASRDRFGQDTAYSIGIPARGAVLEAEPSRLIRELDLRYRPQVPDGVLARQTDAKHILYLNLEGTPKQMTLAGTSHSLLSNQDRRDSFVLNPFESDFVELP